MSQEVAHWLDNILEEIEGIEVRRKSSRRVRVDVPADALPALLELLQGRAGYIHLSAISCVDWIDENEFETGLSCLVIRKSFIGLGTHAPNLPGSGCLSLRI